MCFSFSAILHVSRFLLLVSFVFFPMQLSFGGEADHEFSVAQAAYAKGDFATAISIWRKLGDVGSAPAQYEVGRMTLRAEGTNYDTREARQWLERAAKGGYPAAQASLAELLASGRGVEKDEKMAAFWYEAAAAKGNVIAMRELATLYSMGRGVSVDIKKAAALYKSAAERGDAKSQSHLAMIYGTGKGLKRNEYKSYLWQTISAKTLERTDPQEAEATLYIRDWLGTSLTPRQRAAAELEAQKWIDQHPGPK